VVNASPIIALGTIGRLRLLAELATEIFVPPAVATEVRQGGDAASRALERASMFRFPAAVEPLPTVVMWGLGRGETEVISFALGDRRCEALLDDVAARRCATAFDVPSRGTLGVVLLAKERGLIPAAGPVVEELLSAGLYLSRTLVKAALALVDEAD
jgi:predicted nucleic acid-binding protein